MTTVEFITALFYEVDEQLGAIPKHPAAHLWPSEVVTLVISRHSVGRVCTSVNRRLAICGTSLHGSTVCPNRDKLNCTAPTSRPPRLLPCLGCGCPREKTAV